MFDGDEYRSSNAPGSPARRPCRRALGEPVGRRRRRVLAEPQRCVRSSLHTDSRRNRSPIVGARLSQNAR